MDEMIQALLQEINTGNRLLLAEINDPCGDYEKIITCEAIEAAKNNLHSMSEDDIIDLYDRWVR